MSPSFGLWSGLAAVVAAPALPKACLGFLAQIWAKFWIKYESFLGMTSLCAHAQLGGWHPSMSSSPQHAHPVLGLIPLIYQHCNYTACRCDVGCRAWRVLCKCNLSAGKLSFILCLVHTQSCPHAGPPSAAQNSLTARPSD